MSGKISSQRGGGLKSRAKAALKATATMDAAKSEDSRKAYGSRIRRATSADLPAIVKLDQATSGRSKPEYWRDKLAQFSDTHADKRVFLVAEVEGQIVGFITGEIRDFEFGADPRGWVFAVSVDPKMRVKNIGTRLFDEICEIFRRAGVDKVSTLIERDSELVLAFFRSQGMIFGRYIQMEKDIG
ncbi:GNAT family N-acetyltransferase [Bradyrhizobium sp.]|uniref:GNAT family N-acetyltransferase n=1 Tax=Bradyrhizobium sp. TaxID=376 RepID=UPI0025B83C0D|nr:GNAT family N-acetyltransferase [Bradyrhizobium sp.]